MTRLSVESTIQPAWAALPGISPDTWNIIEIKITEGRYLFHTLPGVFSYDHLDPGTELLLENIPVARASKILDMGCGYGIIEITAAIRGANEIHMADDNLYAIASTRENLRNMNINNASVFSSDLYSNLPFYKYDVILSNPPFHSGQAIDYQIADVLIAQGYHKLNPRGSLTIIANTFIPYQKQMLATFHNVAAPCPVSRCGSMLRGSSGSPG